MGSGTLFSTPRGDMPSLPLAQLDKEGGSPQVKKGLCSRHFLRDLPHIAGGGGYKHSRQGTTTYMLAMQCSPAKTTNQHRQVVSCAPAPLLATSASHTSCAIMPAQSHPASVKLVTSEPTNAINPPYTFIVRLHNASVGYRTAKNYSCFIFRLGVPKYGTELFSAYS